jgi:DNA replication and repair protein RecF
VRVRSVRGTHFRCYERLTLDLEPGVVGVVGPNGAGKTALVEMIHFGCLGYSPRTSGEQQMVRFGEEFTRVEIEAELRSGPVSVELAYRPGEPKRVRVGGAAERSIERLLSRFPVLVFTPERMRLVQGPPAMRRSYVDRILARLWPSLGAASAEYGRALAQRNHLLRRVRAQMAPPGALDPWDQMLARAGAALVIARGRLCTRLTAPYTRRLEELGGEPGSRPLAYEPDLEGDEAAMLLALAARRTRDVERATTGIGPHLDDLVLSERDRDLRHYGSQGEQRRALLALILAEADLLTEEREERPLLLLDDVTGELDGNRRAALLDAVAVFDQAILTTTDEADLAGRAGSLVRVAAGSVV